jgi:hypothetical protein
VRQLFQDQTVDDMKRYFQGGSVAAFQHVAMLRLHYKIARALDEGLASLEFDEGPNEPPRRRRSQLYKEKSLKKMSVVGGGVHFTKLDSKAMIEIQPISTTSSATTVSDAYGLVSDDEHEKGGFDGIDCAFNTVRRSSSAVE